ncbi:hypothetical protein FXO37_30889 [Capsicum annuum]|nr:hypothetical protein FXO37_30889 [Capsicum annuum]
MSIDGERFYWERNSDEKVSSRSPKDGSYYKRIPKLSGIKVLDGPTLMIYGVLGVSLWKFVRFALNYIRDFDGSLKRDVVSTLKKLLIGNLVYGPLINSAFFSFNAGLQEFQDSQSKSLPTFWRFSTVMLGSWVLPLFEDYNDNMDVPDENINEDAPLSYREYENFCFVRKQLLQIENQQSTLLDLLQGFNGSSQRKKRIARDDETASFFISVGLTGFHSLIAYNIKLEP